MPIDLLRCWIVDRVQYRGFHQGEVLLTVQCVWRWYRQGEVLQCTRVALVSLVSLVRCWSDVTEVLRTTVCVALVDIVGQMLVRCIVGTTSSMTRESRDKK